MKVVTNAYQIGKEIARDLNDFARKQLPRATTKAVTQASEGLKQGLRAQVRAAGLGEKLANTWQNKTRKKGLLVFPKGKDSINAAALVVNTAPHIIAGFDRASIIRAKQGTYLAIPTDNCPLGARGRRIKPSNWPADRYGELQFAHGPRGTAFLYVKVVSRFHKVTGDFRGYRKATARRIKKDEAEIVVMFTLIKQTATKKVLDPEREALKWLSEVNRLITEDLNRGK